MAGRTDPEIPTEQSFREGIEAFQTKEPRQHTYRATLAGVDAVWGNPSAMADQVLTLLASWNRRFQSTSGRPDRDKVVTALKDHLPILSWFKYRQISSMDVEDEDSMQELFTAVLEATEGTKVYSNESGPRTSSVGVAKSLGLLAPAFFPIWDAAIASSHGYDTSPRGADSAAKWEQYRQFCWDMKGWTISIEDRGDDVLEEHPRTTLKLIDEYNYAKHTGNWI